MRLLLFLLSMSWTVHLYSQDLLSDNTLFKLKGDNLVKQSQNLSVSDRGFIELDSTNTIEGLAITGKIIQTKSDSFVRILLEDTSGIEYVVLESSKLYNDTDTVLLSDYCEESRILLDIHPRCLHIYTHNASAEISQIIIQKPPTISKKIQTKRIMELKRLSKSIKSDQSKYIANIINQNNQKYNKLWRAEATELSLLPWEERKKVLGMNDDSFPYGFEYYTTGIFEFGDVSQQINSRSQSLCVDTFDWRNRHGKNWITPVKNQGTGNGCWAFAAVAVTEALVNLYFNQKIDCDLSEQEVISCSGCGSNSGGGNASDALSWISNHGVSEDTSFPFSNSDELCSNKGNYSELIRLNSVYSVSNYADNNYEEVKKALIKYGPLSSGFLYYYGSYVGHDMALVGYSTIHVGDTIRYFDSFHQYPDNFVVIQEGDARIGKTYWIFKNSYGSNSNNDHNGYAYILFNHQWCFRTPNYVTTPVLSLLYNDSDIAVTDDDDDGYYFWGIGAKPSHCPSWVPDEPDGDDSDYSKGPMDMYGNLFDLSAHVNDTISLASDTTWTQKCYIYNNIIVPSGVTLNITNDVVFYNGAKITLLGGTLNINGGRLFNADINVEDAGSDIIIINDGLIEKASGKTFEVPLGTTLEMNYGTIK